MDARSERWAEGTSEKTQTSKYGSYGNRKRKETRDIKEIKWITLGH